ncbi:unnamed protein product [Coccothraustes coccothraustes]
MKGVNFILKGVAKELNIQALKEFGQIYFYNETNLCIDNNFFSKLSFFFTLAENSKLRHVEKDVLIPQIMRDRAKELCSDKVQAFTKCCQETGVLMVVKCRQENAALKDCLVGYYSDPSFYEECKAEYLKQREEYRATGIKKKRQKFTPNV